MRCLIIDDEKWAREILLSYAAKIPSLEVVGSCSSAIAATQFLQSEPAVHLLLLDIEMPELSGFDLLEIVSPAPHVILTTAYPQHALRGYDVGVVDYLLKPITFVRFAKAIARVQGLQPVGVSPAEPEALPTQPTKPTGFCFEHEGIERRLPFESIVCVKSLGNYVTIATTKSSYTIYRTLKAMEAELPGDRFVRVHKSFIVDLERVTLCTATRLKLGELEVPVGRTYARELRARLEKRGPRLSS